MHIRWDDVELFLAAVEQRSLSRAARVLRVTQPTVSRRLADLEREIGDPLFLRSVEGVVLTAVGERLLPLARQMAESFAEVALVAAGAGSTPRGLVRVSAPPGVAFELLAPLAASMRADLPDVQLEILSTVRNVDLVRREADLALRLHAPVARDVVTLASLHEPIAAYAAPRYVATLPKGYTLRDVDWIAWPAPSELPPNPQLAARIPDFAPVFASDDFLVQLRAAEAGVGAIILSRQTARLSLATELLPLRLDFGSMKASLHLLAARSSLGISRVRAVAELLERELRKNARVPRGRHPQADGAR